MAEASGEIIAPPQTVKETREADSNFGLSVNGSQLIALAGLNFLKENGFAHPAKPNLLDRLKILKSRPALQRLASIKELILVGKTQEARDLLGQGLSIPNPVFKQEEVIKQITDALSENIPVYDALENKFAISDSLCEFIQSLPGKSLENPPKEHSSIFLTQLGSKAFVSPETNKLTLNRIGIKPYWSYASLPLDQQHLRYIAEKEVFGEEDNSMAISRLEIFAELAKRYPKVFTHITHSNFLPDILSSGFIGKPYEKGYKGGTIQSERGGVFVETLTFKDASEYPKAIKQLRSGNKITIPSDPPRSAESSNYPLHELEYVSPKSISPIAIFSDKFSQKHNLTGWLADDVADIKDDCLIGILVTPQYKQHLLNWISTWTDERKQRVFGERSPEDVFISSINDLPPLEKQL